jgi:hypothetical protein
MPTAPRINQLLAATIAEQSRAREYAAQNLATTGQGSMDDRSQMRSRVSDQHHAPALVPVVQPMLAPSRWIEVTGIPILQPQHEWLSGRVQFQFSPGFLIGMKGTAVEENKVLVGWNSSIGTHRAAGLRLQFNGGEPLVTSGDSETWLWYSDVFGPYGGGHCAPMLRRVEQSDTLNVALRNDYPATLYNIVLSLAFLYLADRDLPETLLAVDTGRAQR